MGVSAAGTRTPFAIAVVATTAFLLLAVGAAPAHAGSKCKSKSAVPESVSTAKAERSVFCLLNKERSKRGIAKLERQGELDSAAHDHSRLMVDQGCFAHECPGEPSLFDRLGDSGYLSGLGSLLRWGYGENIAWGSGELGTPKSIVRAWMNSEGHRENILDRAFEQIGIGLVWGSPSSTSAPASTYTTDFGYRQK